MDYESLTYKELADRLGVKIESARKQVQRKRWQRVTGNDGTVRIQVPVEFLQMSLDGRSDDISDGPEDRLAPELLMKALETQIDGLKDLVEAERRRADTEGLRADAESKRAEAEGRRADAAEADRDAWRQQAQ
ncbi:hypothetical protein QA646_19845 (plasmid) [Rhizobium sp. CB3090]|uniref:hypothetical protein n=1 Tax=Rhizobium sp. CB3090 TaxID=3039156 RepID=UPI0024B05FA0|nr:hypothetical protein [Rhizobium sp. CB3090]WFU12185.1 hypothetical protein QA646_19845 [Rhizobium sp. CB3090]